MKRTVKVTIEKEYEIELDASLLTDEYVKEFESYMYKLEGNSFDEKIDSLHRYAAESLAQWGDNAHIEGVGYPKWRDAGKYYEDDKVYHVIYHPTDEFVDSEIVE